MRHRDADQEALARSAARRVHGSGSEWRARPGGRGAGARSVAGFRGGNGGPVYAGGGSGAPGGCDAGIAVGSRATGSAGAVCRGHCSGTSQRFWARRHGRVAPADSEPAELSRLAAEARIRRHYDALSAGRWPSLALQVVHAPVFHGLTFSIFVDLERPVEIVALEEALSGEHVDLVLEDTDSPSNVVAK